MAWETGTATNQADLLAKIVTFLTTNAALVTAGQEWTDRGTASGQTTGKWLEGPGLTGTESIIVGLQAVNDVPGDIYAIEIAGAQSFSSGSAWGSQIGKSPTSYVSCWNGSMPYWIVANGQRFVVVIKVSTTYHAMYCGKILPYATPTQYPYPIYIGGESANLVRWSDTNPGFRHFTDPGAPNQSSNTGSYFCNPDGSWSYFQNFYNNSGNETLAGARRSVWPYAGDSSDSNYVHLRIREWRDNIDGSYSLLPLILSTTSPSRQVFGELDGCHYVSGFGNAAENIITVGGQDYLVVQNIFRTSRWHYWALKLA